MYHKNISSTKRHKIKCVQADEMAAASQQPQEGEEGVSDESLAPMCQTHNEPIEFYCQTHKAPACGTCKLMSHRKCQLQDLEQAATGSSGRNLDALQQLRETETDMKKIGEVMESQQKALEAQKNEAIEKIQRKMKEMEVLGEKKIAEVEEKFKQERKSLYREAQDITKSTVLVEMSLKELERATNIGSEEEIFLATRQAEEDVSKYQDIVRESCQVSQTEMCFEVDDRLIDITSIGNVRVEKSTISVDLTPEVTEVLNTQSAKKTMLLDVSPSGQMILLDFDGTTTTSQLSLYSTNKKIQWQLDLPLSLSAAVLDDHQLIVALAGTLQLQIVNMDNNNLTKGPLVKTDLPSILILKYSDSSVLVLAQQCNAKWCFQVLDLTGKVEKHIKLSTDLQNPVFMKMNHDRTTVYIVDQGTGCLGFNLQGDAIFHYTSTDYNVYCGLAVDLHGALYFSAGKQGQSLMCVIKLSPAGQVLRQLDIRGAVPLQCIRNKMYVSSNNDQKEEVIACFYV